mgnify:CR=1 FL=1
MSAMSLKDAVYLSIRVELLELINEQAPHFALRRKSDSFFIKALNFVFFFKKRFSRYQATTVYPVIYVPEFWGKYKKYKNAELEILAHEYIHIYDRKRLGWLYNILYLSPQIFSLFALGAFWNVWFSLFLLFLLPWPSPGRAWLEFRAYRANIAYQYWTNNKKYDMMILVSQFVGPNHYYMMPLKKVLEKWFNREYKKIRNNKLSLELAAVKKAVERGVNVRRIH